MKFSVKVAHYTLKQFLKSAEKLQSLIKEIGDKSLKRIRTHDLRFTRPILTTELWRYATKTYCDVVSRSLRTSMMQELSFFYLKICNLSRQW